MIWDKANNMYIVLSFTLIKMQVADNVSMYFEFVISSFCALE